jgi:two-component system sensor histidine kinase KdpD
MRTEQTDLMKSNGWRKAMGGALPLRRQVAGFAMALVLLPVVTLVLSTVRSEQSLAADALSYQLLVVLVALVGGLWPAILTAIAAAMLLDLFFVAPLFTVVVADPVHVVALVIFVVVGVLVSIVVGQADSRLRAARLLAEEVERTRPLEAADRMRTALLAAVGHDLRTPLAAATAAVGSLASDDVEWSEHDRRELVDTAEVSLARLGRLVDDLLDASRLQAGVLAVSLEPVALDEVLALVSSDVDADNAPGAQQRFDIPRDLPDMMADPVLLHRVLVNLVTNAVKHGSPSPIIEADATADTVRVRVIDHGPGIPPSRRTAVFEPFQREGDVGTGVGLGLALSRGFVEAMGGTLEPSETAGGGTTMTVTIPRAT